MAYRGKDAEKRIRNLNDASNSLKKQIDDFAYKLRRRIEMIDKQIEEIEVGETPIKVGMIITWTVGRPANQITRRGRVISVQKCGRWSGVDFEYRCRVLSKAGKEIGFQCVRDFHGPVIEQKPSRAVAVKKLPAKKSANRSAK